MSRSTRASALVAAMLFAASPVGARNEGADGRFEKRTSSHFVLYQDVDIDETGGLRGSRRFEQQVLDVLEKAYDRLDALLGLRPRRKLDVMVYDPRIFDAQFGGLFPFGVAGFYADVIRIRGAERMHVGLSEVLHHELVHAAWQAAAPSYTPPAWLNEGTAEWFAARALGKRHLSGGQLGVLQRARNGGGLFSLAQLSGPSFSRMTSGSARLAYIQAYAVIEFVARTHGERAVRDLCRQVVRSRDLDRALRRVLRTDLAGLEVSFLDDLG